MKNKAFTLIELLLSVSILVIVSSALYSFFYSGKKVYQRLRETDEVRFPYFKFSEIFHRDVSGITLWRDRRMVLNAERLYFISKDETGAGSIKRVDYFIRKNPEGNTFFIERFERLYPFDEEKEPENGVRFMDRSIDIKIKAVAACKIPDEDGKALKSVLRELDTWKLKNFPLALSIKIRTSENEYRWREILPEYRFDYNKTCEIEMTEKNE